MIRLRDILTEGGNLVVVDIQPEYEKAFGFKAHEFVDHLFSADYDNIFYLYNGHDTLGMVTEDDLKNWIAENSADGDYDAAYEKMDYIEFYDKGYAFFRYCIDSGIHNDDVVALVKFMSERDINDSRDLDEDFWSDFVDKYKEHLDLNPQEVRELLEFSDDMINIPDLMDFLTRIRGDITLIGGGVEECLKEVIIALEALDKSYDVDHEWTY
jgi:hypothetical protein